MHHQHVTIKGTDNIMHVLMHSRHMHDLCAMHEHFIIFH